MRDVRIMVMQPGSNNTSVKVVFSSLRGATRLHVGQKIDVLYSVHSLFSEVFFSSSEERWVLGQCSNNAFSINAPRFTAGRGGRVNMCECKQQTR